MRYRMCVRDVLVSCVLAIGCTGQVRAEDQPVEASTPVSPPTTSAATAAAPAEAATAATAAISPTPAAEQEEEQLQRLEFERVAKQYRKTEKDGQPYYCRSEKTLGTRLPKTVCLTEPQLWERIRKAEDARDAMRFAKPGPCQPSMPCQ